MTVKLTIGFEIIGEDQFGPIAREEIVEYAPSIDVLQSDITLKEHVLHFLVYTQEDWQFCHYVGVDGMERHLYISDWNLT